MKWQVIRNDVKAVCDLLGVRELKANVYNRGVKVVVYMDSEGVIVLGARRKYEDMDEEELRGVSKRLVLVLGEHLRLGSILFKVKGE